MAAGLGFKDFTTGEVLTAADVDGYLMQGVWVFASATARDAAVTSPQEGNFAYLKDTNVTTYYTGSAWANLDTTGMTNPMTTTGDTIYSSSGSTPARLGIGTAGQILRVNSGATAPEWATPASATPSFSLLATQAVTTGSSYSITSLSGYNTLFVICAGLSSTAASTTYTMTFNSDSGSNYIVGAAGIDSGSAGQYGGTDTKISWATQGNNAANLVSASFQISAANSTGTKVGMQGGGGNGTASLVRFGGFSYSGSSVISSVQITTSGTFDAGTIYVYGSVA